MIRNVISFVCIILIFVTTQNIAITIVGSFAVVLITRGLEPLFTPLFTQFSTKYFPKPNINLVREQDLMEEVGRGVRVLVVTQFNEFKREDEASMALYDSIFAEAVEALRQAKPLFNLRYNTVLERKLPMQFFTSICGEKNSGVRKCYSTWLNSINSKDFGVWKENSELFLHDGTFDDPATGEARSSIVIFLFDTRLPKTIVTKTDEPTPPAQDV